MYLEIFIEDRSGKEALDLLLPKILPAGTLFRVVAYKGLGRVPKDITKHQDASKRALLNSLPQLLRGLGRTFSAYPDDYPAAAVIVCDLDDRKKSDFVAELTAVLDACNPRPLTCFCIAVEEGESWLLGDLDAINRSYPNAKQSVLNAYVNDSICGTWEVLADAVYSGGHEKLKTGGWQAVGKEKSIWARKICPEMDIHNNSSPSFNYFVECVSNLSSS